MTTATGTERDSWTEDVAADLTEAALEALAGAGVPADSVAAELDLWRALAAELEHQSGARRRLLFGGLPPLEGVAREVVHRAALRVAGDYAPELDPAELDAKIRPRVASLRVTGRQRLDLARLLASKESDWKRPLGRSGVVRKLAIVALN